MSLASWPLLYPAAGKSTTEVVPREALESSSPPFQGGATPSQLSRRRNGPPSRNCTCTSEDTAPSTLRVCCFAIGGWWARRESNPQVSCLLRAARLPFRHGPSIGSL